MPESEETILVVDDESNVRTVCQRVLGSLGFKILLASDAKEALSYFTNGPPDLVLTDISMPGQSGIELLQEIKRRHPDCDVVIMTAFPNLETALPAIRSGAFDYLVKPFDQTELKAVVTRCFEKRRAKGGQP